MAQDVVVHFDHRRQRALAKASNRANSEFAVGSSEGHLIRIAGLA
jgi:hypothetical protein